MSVSDAVRKRCMVKACTHSGVFVINRTCLPAAAHVLNPMGVCVLAAGRCPGDCQRVIAGVRACAMECWFA